MRFIEPYADVPLIDRVSDIFLSRPPGEQEYQIEHVNYFIDTDDKERANPTRKSLNLELLREALPLE